MMSDAIDRPAENQREFARIPVEWRARVKPVDAAQAGKLAQKLAERPSVWEPTSEAALRDLVISASGSHEAMLAQAILDLSGQIVRIRAKLAEPDPALVAVDVTQLSGGGGMLATRLPLKEEDRLEIRFEPDDDLPPIQGLIRVVHAYGGPQQGYGFSFEAIHPKDQDRLIRLIYQLQRRALREAHDEEEARTGV